MAISNFARAAAALKDMWIIDSPNTITMGSGLPNRIGVCARPVNDSSYIAAVIFEVLPEFAEDDAVWLEILSQLERTEHI